MANQKTTKDAFGNTVAIGDTVAYAVRTHSSWSNSRSALSRGTVTDVSKCYVWINDPNADPYRQPGPIQVGINAVCRL